VDSGGNLYFTSAVSGDVHKESLQPDGSYVASAIGFGISGPAGVAVDGAGDVFIADPAQGKVYEEVLQADGSYRQSTLAIELAEPQGIVLDSGGSLYITSSNGNLYREALRQDGSWLQTIVSNGLEKPGGIALDTLGNIYVSLDLAEAVDKIDLADPPILNFAKTAVGSTSTDSPQTLTVLSMGNTYPRFPRDCIRRPCHPAFQPIGYQEERRVAGSRNHLRRHTHHRAGQPGQRQGGPYHRHYGHRQ
jgi:DNA-binding beta-propeller fold protein YncE